MSEQTPSQAEGERDDRKQRRSRDAKPTPPPRTTPSQAEGERGSEQSGKGEHGGEEVPPAAT